MNFWEIVNVCQVTYTKATTSENFTNQSINVAQSLKNFISSGLQIYYLIKFI